MNLVDTRHIIAKSDIQAGKTVLIEEPFAFRMIETICAFCIICMKKAMNFVPCDQCTSAMICRDCMDKKYLHDMECDKDQCTRMLQKWLRCIFTVIGEFPTAADLMEFIETTLKQAVKQAPHPFTDKMSKYREFLKLNVCARSIKEEEILREAFIAYNYMLNQKSFQKFFTIEPERRFLMHWLVHHSYIFDCNSFGGPRDESVFILSSYFNHSCEPNLIVSVCGSTQTVITLRPIKKGQQLFVNYKQENDIRTVETQSTRKRQKRLSEMYGFQCRCNRCEFDASPNAGSLARNPDYNFVIENCKQVGHNKEKALLLREKCVNILTKFGNKRWSSDLEVIIILFGALLFEIQNPDNFMFDLID